MYVIIFILRIFFFVTIITITIITIITKFIHPEKY